MIHLTYVHWLLLAVAFAIGAASLTLELTNREQLTSLRKARNSQKYGLADELPYRTLIRPDLIKNANDSYVRMFEIQLPRKEELDEHAVADSDVGLAKAMALFGSDCVTHFHDVHTDFAEYDKPIEYWHPLLQMLDETREKWFRTPGRVFASRYIYSVTWKPPTGAANILQERMRQGGVAAIMTENEAIDDFDRRCAEFEHFARAYGDVRRLSVRDGCSEMLQHLSWCVSGRDRKIRVPFPGTLLNGVIAEAMERAPSFKVGEQHVRSIVITAVPNNTYPLFLARLRELRAPYSLVLRFNPDDGSRARRLAHDAMMDWMSKSKEQTAYVDPFAAEMMESARQAIGAISQGLVRFGRASIFVVVRHPTSEGVERLATRAVSLLDELNLPAYIARGRTQEEDYFGTLPSDGYHSLRKFPIHALNLAHFISAHGESLGRKYNGGTNLPATTPAVMYSTTPEKSQVRLHLSDREQPQVQHYLSIGGTGRGKSVFAGALTASWMARFPGAGFTGIDRGRSLYRLTKFLDGNFYDFLGPTSPGFAIFANVDRPDQASDALRIIKVMIALQGVAIEPEEQKALEDAMVNVAELRPGLRSLTAFHEALQDRRGKMRDAIRNYLRDNMTVGATFDREEDTFRTSRFNVVDLGRVANLDPIYLIPFYETLFWKAKTHVGMMREAQAECGITTGLNWHYLIDEAHTLTKHPLGRKFIVDFLKMGRKEKFCLGLWSNAAVDFTDSGIMNDIGEACRTRILFKNQAVESDPEMRKLFVEKLQTPARAIERLPRLAQHAVLWVQPNTGEVWELDTALDKAWLAVVGKTDAADNARVDDFIVRYGPRWKEELLRFEGVSASQVDRFLELLQQRGEALQFAS